MEYLIRLIQIHETFRKPELEALAEIGNIKLEIVYYSAHVSTSKSFQPRNNHSTTFSCIDNCSSIVFMSTWFF